ncbi:hypothetical protein MLD38_002548 [Melastoma candidum]|uniref:Uncharacterized protein n=1 Tax=Melastoma candidum TaxID=119954 RepID=A0ACB9S179_9MYRT|nr:hypothetical protein MLD38_002548 [Melastoma candidum]
MNFHFCCYRIILLSFFVLSEGGVSARHGRVSTDPCDLYVRHKGHYVSSDQITVLMNGFSEYRIPLLLSLASSYTFSPLVSSMIVLWDNPLTPSPLLSQLSHNLSLISGSIHLIQQPSGSLNARFSSRPDLIKTRAVLVSDDDVEVDNKSLEFAFRIWASNQDSLVGFFARSHDLDLSTKEWIYTVHPDRYSIVLTKIMILKTEYLFKYSCGGPALMEMRRVVDEMQNCEDILMNFVVADDANVGPILVGSEKLRDYGDARNEEKNDSFREVGLSSRKGDHRKMRGFCIREFHRILKRMPLRYSHGKVIDSVGEQGLCKKGGQLVRCDDFSLG